MSGSTILNKATLSQRVALFFLSPLFPWFSACCATALVVLTINVADDLSPLPSGPGLTFDEGFNIEVGVYLVRSFLDAGWSSLHPETQQEIYANPLYNPDHPPLGRIALGVSNEILKATLAPDSDRPYVVSYARMASAVEFGVLVFLVAFYTRRWFGPLASCVAAISLILMPRMFGHAHLASLETCTCLTYSAFVIVTADRCWRRETLRSGRMLLPAVILGAALLTKIHAVLLIPVLLVWGLWNWGLRSILPVATLLIVALALFFVGWPWLWLNPGLHLLEYFSSATERASLNCFYLGEKYADRAVPWHYPFVMFATTMPLGFLIAGLFGLVNRTGDENSRTAIFDRRSQFVFGAWLLPMIVFALPGVTVYDGVRLFLMCFPLFSIFVGLGARHILEAIQRRNGAAAATVLVAVTIAGPIYNLITLHPCSLSYYSTAVGGLWKADDLGFEVTYWGDSVTPNFLERGLAQLPEGAILEVAPVLHPLQLEFMKKGSWLRHRPDLSLRAYDDQRDDLSPYVLVIRRKADPWASLTPPPQGTRVLSVVKRQGTILTELLELPTE